MSVKVVRMLSGEDVLCVCEDKDHFFEIQDGVVVVPTQNQSVQFVPYSPFTTKDALMINKDMVVFVANPDKSLEDQHKKMFGGIITPDSKIIA
jgi:hypothetical protein